MYASFTGYRNKSTENTVKTDDHEIYCLPKS